MFSAFISPRRTITGLAERDLLSSTREIPAAYFMWVRNQFSILANSARLTTPERVRAQSYLFREGDTCTIRDFNAPTGSLTSLSPGWRSQTTTRRVLENILESRSPTERSKSRLSAAPVLSYARAPLGKCGMSRR